MSSDAKITLPRAPADREVEADKLPVAGPVPEIQARPAPADRLKVVTAFKAAKRRRLDDEAAEREAFRRYGDSGPDDDEEEEDEIEVAPVSRALHDQVSEHLPRSRRGPRFGAVQISFLVMVVLPVVVAAVYLYFIAAPQYASEFRFSVRTQEQPATNSAAGSLSAVQTASALMLLSNNYIIMDYLKSRDALEALDRDVGFDRVYASPLADWWARLSGDATTEDRVQYWQSRISTSFDMTTGIALVQVRAFSAEDSLAVAKSLVGIGEKLINDLQARARRDAIKFFEDEVTKAELRLKLARNQVRDYRNRNQIATPESSGSALLGTIAKLEQDLSAMRTELVTMTGFMKADAPSVLVLKGRIKASEEQLAKLKTQVGSTEGSDPSRLSDLFADYSELEQNRMFAEKLYESAVTSLESARGNAAMQHTYLATFVTPKIAESARYPLRLPSITIVALTAFFLWFVSLMAGYAIRDHAI